MGLARVRDLVVKGYDEGNQWESSFRKVPALASQQGVWSDLSGAPGNPKPNYYVGAELTSTALSGADGIWHGGDVTPKTKHLHRMLISSTGAGVAPATFLLCDYLLFYPLVDMDSTDEQLFVNSVALPRYTGGDGVRMFLVATNPFIGGAAFFVNYINHQGLARTSRVETSNTGTFISQIVHSGLAAANAGPFITTPQRDGGVREATSIQFLAPNGGLAALVLAKVLGNVMLNETTACAEWDFLMMKPTLPRIYDGAYLNLLACPNGSMAAVPITGLMSVVWN